MRNGPKPLPFQLGMASLASAGMAGGTAFSNSTLQDFFVGIKKYQAHPFQRLMPKLPKIWSAGNVRLFSAQQRILHKTPIVLIPSMVNKSDILDLLPDRSLLRWLAGQGFDPYLIDWGYPSQDEGQTSIDSTMMQRLIPAIESLGQPVLLLGYCMGGLFAAALSSLRPDLVKGCLLLATPWNFHDQKGSLKARLSLMKPMALPYMTQYNHLPDSWMQAVFATLDPEGSIRKFSGFATMQGEEKEAMFVAVEDWLNDGLDLPAAIAQTCMDDWYEHNLPFNEKWQVAGKIIKAKEIRVPTFVVAATDDKIVPLDSAMAFAHQRVKCDRLVCSTGHVGLLAGRKSMTDIWQPMAAWFALQQ